MLRFLRTLFRPAASNARPRLRHAEVLSPDAFRAALASNDPEHIKHAFIDGSRCLDAALVIPAALAYLAKVAPKGTIFVPGLPPPKPVPHHPPHDGIVYGCLFAIEFYQAGLIPYLTRNLVRALAYLARCSPDESIRSSAIDLLTSIISHQMPD